MLRLLICVLILAACATVPKPKGLADCTEVAILAYDPRNEIVNETQTMGPSQVIWLHAPPTVKGYFKEADGHIFRCPSPR